MQDQTQPSEAKYDMVRQMGSNSLSAKGPNQHRGLDCGPRMDQECAMRYKNLRWLMHITKHIT